LNKLQKTPHEDPRISRRPKEPHRTAKGTLGQEQPKGAKGSQRAKPEFTTTMIHGKDTIVIQPKGNKSSAHTFEKLGTHPEDLFGNFMQPKSFPTGNLMSSHGPYCHFGTTSAA